VRARVPIDVLRCTIAGQQDGGGGAAGEEERHRTTGGRRLISLSASANYDCDFLKNAELASFPANDVTSPRDGTAVVVGRAERGSADSYEEDFFFIFIPHKKRRRIGVTELINERFRHSPFYSRTTQTTQTKRDMSHKTYSDLFLLFRAREFAR